LKPAKLRGVESKGMLLAASLSGEGGKEAVEVLSAPWASPGTPVTIEGLGREGRPEALIDVDTFFSVPLVAKEGFAFAGSARLEAAGQTIQLQNVRDGEIG